MAALALSSWPDSVAVLELTFDPADWAYACDHPALDIEVPAVLHADGTEMEATFRIRGQSSRYYPKKSIKVRILDGQRLWGFDELNLNGEYLDYTRIRENLSYIFHRRAGGIVPETHMVELLFNGDTQGPYLFVEDVDGEFLARHPLADDGVVYKCWMDASCLDRPWELDLYQKKTHEDDPWDDLELLINWLAYTPDSTFRGGLAQRVAYDELLTFVAANVLVGHGSCYYHNYHMILDRPGGTGFWHPVTWDMDRTWNRSYAWNIPYYWSANTSNRPNPLVWRSWASDGIRADLIDRVRELEPLLLDMEVSGTIDSLAALAEPLVEVDPFRDYTMEEYQDELQQVTGWPENRTGALEEQFQSWPEPFRTYRPFRQEGLCHLRWGDAGPGCAYLVEVSTDSTFGDPSYLVGQWSTPDTTMTLAGYQAPYGAYWRVKADNGSKSIVCVNRQRSLDPFWQAPTLHAGLVLNEINYASPPDAAAGDWLELVNPGPDTIWTGGWSLRDGTEDNLHTMGHCVLPPGEAVVIYTDSAAFFTQHPGCPADDQPMGFGLASEGERLRIFDLSGEMVDFVRYDSRSPWPEEPNGMGPTLSLLDPSLDNSLAQSWVAGPFKGTPGLPNDSVPSWEAGARLVLGPVSPNPATGSASLRVSLLYSGEARLRIYDLAGRVRHEGGSRELPRGTSVLQLDLSGLEPGIYYVVVSCRGLTRSSGMVVLSR